MKNITIIGGGIIGLSCAYYLVRDGHAVTVIDRNNEHEGSSNQNAGMIVPSHIIPLASPGMISKGIQWMFNSQSPFYVKPRLSGDLVRWGIKFYQSANEQHVRKSIPVLRDLSLISRQLFNDINTEIGNSFLFSERGLMMLYKTKSTEHEEIEAAKLANEAGVRAEILSQSDVQKFETDFQVDVLGGVYYPGDAHLNPSLLMQNLKKYLLEKNVNIISGEEVKSLETKNGNVFSVITSNGRIPTDAVVIATGAWSPELTRLLGLNLLLQGGKGYSFTLSDMTKNIQIPSILLERRVAVTPMGNQLRIGGTMEIGGIDLTIHKNRVKGIVDSMQKYYPEMDVRFPEKIWRGLRPCSPDGLPYIGKMKSYENAFAATGHGMMGLSLGPVTGKLISEMIGNKKTEIETEPFSPNRFD